MPSWLPSALGNCVRIQYQEVLLAMIVEHLSSIFGDKFRSLGLYALFGHQFVGGMQWIASI